MISSRSSGRSSRCTSPYSGTSCSSSRRIRSVAETYGLDPEQLEVRPVPRVVDPGDDPVDQVLLLRHLADQHVVLVVAGHRDHHVGARDPRPLQHPELRRVPVLDVVLELLLDRQVPVPVVLDHGHLVTLVEQLPGQVPADLAGPGDDDVLAARPSARRPSRRRRPPGPPSRASRSRPASGRSCCTPLLLVPLGPQRIEDPRDHRRHVEPPLRDLGDDDVRVVAVGGGDEGVGPLDPGGGQRLLLERRCRP